MIRLHEGGVFWHDGKPVEELAGGCRETPEEMEAIIRSEYQGRD